MVNFSASPGEKNSHAQKANRVLYLNVHDVNYPRNKAIREFLERRNCEVVIVDREDKSLFFMAWLGLVFRAIRCKGPFDFVILSEFSIQYALFAKVVALRFGSIFVVDAFVGLHESIVQDWKSVRSDSVRAKGFMAFDMLAAAVADFMFIDTDVRRDALTSRTRTPVLTLPVGAPAWAKPQCVMRSPMSRIRVLYYGNYIPLHGLEYVVNNIGMIRNPADYDFVFIGNGSLRSGIESLAYNLNLESRITFEDSIDIDALMAEIRLADIVLGVFGDSPKAASVLANKVWQGLSCGKIVVTRESTALEELRMLSPKQLVAVDVNESYALARALELIAEESHAGRACFEESRAVLDEYVERRFDLAATFMGL